MLRRLLVMTIVPGLMISGLSCGKKPSDGDPSEDRARPPVAPLPPVAVPSPVPPVPEPKVARSSEGLGKLLDRFNACVGAVAEIIRASDASVTVPVKQIGDCEKLFDEILATRQVVISEPYAEYFVLAAQVLSRLRLPAPGAGDPAVPFPVKEFITDYNAFALRNNELMGIPVIEPAPAEVVRRSVPRRTYRDELAQLGQTLETAVRDWSFAHHFETLGSGAPAAWLSGAGLERVRFWMLRLKLEDQLGDFARFDCDNAGTGPEEKITCDTLQGAGRALSKSAQDWVDAWTQLLGLLGPSPGAFPAAARKSCDDRQAALEEKIRELPGRIE
ncbi:hypothetical protein KJ975_03220 [Myxococcota bacterium]|nr:hypothetical protein [Myxococcota bacterium]